MLSYDVLMRTTVRIDDELYRAIKEQAARSGRTVAAVLEDAVRRGMSEPAAAPAARFLVRPTGSGGLRPGVDLGSNASLREIDDEERSLEELR